MDVQVQQASGAKIHSSFPKEFLDDQVRTHATQALKLHFTTIEISNRLHLGNVS
jgi:hypothetical protein